jgi:hypothetical protein
VSYEFLRGVLGVIGVACAFLAGRTCFAVRKGRVKLSRLYAWVIRSAACLGAMIIRHPLDVVAIAVWTLAAVAFAVAYWESSRERPPEDLTDQIFPHES